MLEAGLRSREIAHTEAKWEAQTLFGLLLGLIGVSLLILVWQIATPQPVQFAGVTIDRLSTTLTLFVTIIGTVTFRFSVRYLDGNPLRRRFLRLLAFTVGAACLFICSTNLLLLFAVWALISLGLHQLLTIYPDRPEANRPARKKFLISRLGDIALIGAIALIWRDWGTLDLNEFLQAVSVAKDSSSLGMIGWLVAVAALTKSAQFPFHSWLPETMESPTPVSAFMHAGIINAGGVLLLRFAPVIVRVPEVMLLLSLVGTLTFTLGTIAMWAQVKIKRTLAWSTVSQMGFMMVQCGLAAFPAMAIHIVGHGCYKAWSFLRSGDLPPRGAKPAPPLGGLMLAALGSLVAVPMLAYAAWVTGYSPLHSPGEFALSTIVAFSCGQLWVALLGIATPKWSRWTFNLIVAVVASLVVTVSAFGLYRGAANFLLPVLGELPPTTGSLAWVAAAIPIIALVILIVIHAYLPVIGRSPLGRAIHVHALHGFYFGAIADRVVDAVWSRSSTIESGVTHA